MFCTLVENGIDSCGGDSGKTQVQIAYSLPTVFITTLLKPGGAIVRNGVQVGIVSFGSEDCGDGSLPAVYVRIEDPAIRDFIRLHTSV